MNASIKLLKSNKLGAISSLIGISHFVTPLAALFLLSIFGVTNYSRAPSSVSMEMLIENILWPVTLGFVALGPLWSFASQLSSLAGLGAALFGLVRNRENRFLLFFGFSANALVWIFTVAFLEIASKWNR